MSPVDGMFEAVGTKHYRAVITFALHKPLISGQILLTHPHVELLPFVLDLCDAFSFGGISYHKKATCMIVTSHRHNRMQKHAVLNICPSAPPLPDILFVNVLMVSKD